MPIRISKIAKELNVGVSTAAEFLRKHDIEVDETNPNARIGEDAADLLRKEYSKDKDTKTRSDIFTTSRLTGKKASKQNRSRTEEIKTEVPKAAGPRVLGKIDLSTGSAITPKPEKPKADTEAKPQQAESRPAPEAKTEPKPQPEKKAKADDSHKQPAQELKPEPKPEAKPEATAEKAEPTQPASPAKAPEHKPASKPLPAKEEKPEKKADEKQAPEKPQPAEEKKAPEATENDGGVFRLKTPGAGIQLKVVDKIDLSALNQNTRPKKKSKEERRKERIDRSHAGGAAAKRERGPKRPVKQEVNSEDVQRQVKETLARLTNKTTKKSVKWRKEKREEMHHREMENAEREAAQSKIIKITEFVTANDLAQLMDVPINNIIATCMNLGVMVSINQRLDAETINIVAEEFGFTTEYVSADVTEAITTVEDAEEDLLPRPPIVTVMGHVDHGKTSLLDYIRKANVIAGEAGGITQHIGAYNVELSDGRHITFLDTPGHEAFTAMRARGAKVTDLAIIIVAADDDVMPQTVEAINHASAAGVPMVFAINKIDKPTANPDKIKEQLSAMNYLVEEWGGKYQSQDISAKKGLGVDELMEKVLLEAEMLDLKANPDRAAIGSVIESSLDKGRGYVATVLVQNGTLRVGDVVLAGTHYGKIKAMFNERNQRVKEAGPSTPVLILGLNGAPTAGDTFNVLETEQEAREIAGKREQLQRELGLRTKKRLGLEELGRRRALDDFHELNLVVKGDVDGSIEALSDSLIKLSTPEVQVNVLHKGVGAISESDVTLAAASDAIIIGFQVRPSGAARKEAEKEGVEIRLYSVIYKAIEEVKDAMEGMLAPEIKEEITGNAEVLQTYHISKVGTIAGAIVRDGKIKRTSKVRLIRDGIVVYTGELGSLKRFKDDVKDVVSGYDCGLSIQGYNDVREGDIIEAYEEVAVKKTLTQGTKD